MIETTYYDLILYVTCHDHIYPSCFNNVQFRRGDFWKYAHKEVLTHHCHSRRRSSHVKHWITMTLVNKYRKNRQTTIDKDWWKFLVIYGTWHPMERPSFFFFRFNEYRNTNLYMEISVSILCSKRQGAK